MASKTELLINTCHTIAETWGTPRVLILALDERGEISMATHGNDNHVRVFTRMLGKRAFKHMHAHAYTVMDQCEAQEGD